MASMPTSMWGWGCSGHHLVALIAREHLNPRALEVRAAVPVEAVNAATDCPTETAKVRALNIGIGKDYRSSAMEANRAAPYQCRLSLGGIAEPDLALSSAQPL